MTFIRIKRIPKKGGGFYEYPVRQKSVWVNGRVKSIYLGRVEKDWEREVDRTIESVLRAAERQGNEAEEWQRKHLGATAVEMREREAKANEWSQSKVLQEEGEPKASSDTPASTSIPPCNASGAQD
jgi:hypothetical protein